MRPGENPTVIRVLRGIFKRFRLLRQTPVEYERLHEIRAATSTHYEEAKAAWGMLPAGLREKAWILGMERGG